MTFTEAELAYLDSQPLGRLATVNRDGSPQVSPIGFSYNEEFGTIDIGGFNMSRSAKYRNAAAHEAVAIVVDDLASRDPWRVRCLEIRGVAEVVPDPGGDPQPGRDSALIRIHPRRIISFGVEDQDQEPARNDVAQPGRRVASRVRRDRGPRPTAPALTSMSAARPWRCTRRPGSWPCRRRDW